MQALPVQRLRASLGDKEKERGGVIRIFLSALRALDEMVKFLALACLSVRPPTCSRLALALRDFLHNIYRSANVSDNDGLFEYRAEKYGKSGETALCFLVFRRGSS